MSKNVCEFKDQRDSNLIRVYREMLSNEPYPVKLRNVIRKTIMHPAERFWVSPERAFLVISKMDKGIDCPVAQPVRRSMFVEIYRRVKELQRECPETSLYLLTEEVVNGVAPQFYLTLESAIIILHRIKKIECYKQRLKRHPYLH